MTADNAERELPTEAGAEIKTGDPNWIPYDQLCDKLTAAESTIASLRAELEAQQKEIAIAREYTLDFVAWRNTDDGRRACEATRLMIDADNKRIAAESEVSRLKEENERLRKESADKSRLFDQVCDNFMREALVAIAGAVCTPERGYKEDGGFNLLLSDIKLLRKQHDAAESELTALRQQLKAARPKRIDGDGYPDLPTGHVIAGRMIDGRVNAWLCQPECLGQRGAVYLDYGIPDFSEPTALEAKNG